MDTRTTTAGLTFAAATQAEVDEFRRVRDTMPRMLAEWRAYIDTPLFVRHFQRFIITSEHSAEAMQELSDGWAAGWVELLAQAVVSTRPMAPVHSTMTGLRLDQCVAHEIQWRCAKINQISGIPLGHSVTMFLNSELRAPVAEVLAEQGRFLREFLLGELRGKSPFEVRYHQVLEAVLARIEHPDLGHFIAVLPSQLAPEDIEADGDWAARCAHDWTSASLRGHLAALRADFRRAEEARLHSMGACWGTARYFVRKYFSQKADIPRLSWWSWCAIACIEQANREVFDGYRLDIASPVLTQRDWGQGVSSYWQFLLAGAGAVSPEQLAEGIERFVLSPRTLARWAVPRDSAAGRLKHVLREMSDLALGEVRETVQFRHLATRVQGREATLPERLGLLGQFLAYSFARLPADNAVGAPVERLLREALCNAESIMAGGDCVLCTERLQSPDDVAFDQLLAAEAEEARRANNEFQRWIAEALRPEKAAYPTHEEADGAAEGAELPPEEPVALRYVDNLGAAQWRVWDFASARERLGRDLEVFFGEHGIESVVPARSVAEALRHFLYELTPEQRHELPLEKIAGAGWRKMKRGGQRIYVLERDGAVYFHILKRRDWVHADLLEARY